MQRGNKQQKSRVVPPTQGLKRCISSSLLGASPTRPVTPLNQSTRVTSTPIMPTSAHMSSMITPTRRITPHPRAPLYSLGSDTLSDDSASPSSHGSDSPFVLNDHNLDSARSMRRAAKKAVKTHFSQRQPGDYNHSSSDPIGVKKFHPHSTSTPSSTDQTIHHQRQHTTHRPFIKSLHQRPKFKSIPAQLASFQNNPTLSDLQQANPTMNDDIERLVRTEEELSTSELSSSETPERILDIPLRDETIPHPSQLTQHYPEFIGQDLAHDSANAAPIKAKYHPRLQKQLDDAKRQDRLKASKQYRNRFKYTEPLLKTEEDPEFIRAGQDEGIEGLQPLDIDDVDNDDDDDDDDDVDLPPPGACTIEEAMECVVKIFVTQSLPNFLQPWQKRPSTDHMGSGFVIKGKRIVTNAHVVADALVVLIRRPGSSRKHIARVVASAHECDLALLEVEDETFWGPDATSIDFEQGTIGLESKRVDSTSNSMIRTNLKMKKTKVSDTEEDFGDDAEVFAARNGGNDNVPDLPGVGPGSVGSPWWTSLAPDAPRKRKKSVAAGSNTIVFKEDNFEVPTFTTTTPFIKEPGSLYVSPAMPGLQSSVVVIGYPLGGDNVSITQGVVSRIEPTTYAHTGTYLLGIQIDAAINPGNSGGPALSIDGRVIGVAFQNITNASNVGYIIPAPVIIHFLRDVQRGAYRITKHTKDNMRNMNKLTLFSQDKQTQTNTPIIPPETTPGTDQRFFTPYLSGFPAIGLFCQETTSESLRDYIGLNSCTKLTPVTEQAQSNSNNPGFHLLDAVAELRRYRELKNHQSLDTPVQHFQRLRQYQIQSAAFAVENSKSDLVDITDYTLFNYETTTVPAAYSHYYMLEEHIKEDVRRKRQFPTIDHGVDQVGTSESNRVLKLANEDYQVNKVSDPLGLNQHRGDNKNNIVQIKQRYSKEPISGVLVSEVSSLSSFNKLVFPGDVLLSVDGHELGSDGSVHFRGHERIAFDHITSLKHEKQIIQLTILRRKKNLPERQPSSNHSIVNMSDVPVINKAADENIGHFPTIGDESESDDDDDDDDDDFNNYHSHYDEGIQYADKHKNEKKPKKNKNKKTVAVADSSNPLSKAKKKKLKLRNRALYQHRIVAPCDQCTHDVDVPPYNATFYQQIHDIEPSSTPTTENHTELPTSPTPTQLNQLTNKKKIWNTALGLAADYIYTKQNNPALKQILKDNLEKMKSNASQTPAEISSNAHTSEQPLELSPPQPNAINSPAHYTRLPLNYAHTPHPGKQFPEKYTIPSTTLKHTLCIHKDFELITVKAPVSILPTTSPNVYDRGTAYVFFGGLLFVPLSYQYTKDVGGDAPLHLTLARCAGLASHDEEKVILAQVLQDNETVGYPYLDRPISHICGVPVRNMKGLLEVIHSKSILASVSNLVKSTLLKHPQDLPLLLHMLQTNNSVNYHHRPHITITKDVDGAANKNTHNNNNVDGKKRAAENTSDTVYDEKTIPVTWSDPNTFTVYTVTPDAEKRCKQMYEMMCSLSDILCSETDIETYTGSLLNIYNNIPSQSPWKRYLLQVLDMYLHPNDLTPIPRNSSLSNTTHDQFTKKSIKNGEETDQFSSTLHVSHHIHRQHSTPTQQVILALFHSDIRKFTLGSIPMSLIKPDGVEIPQPPEPFSPIDFLPFKPHTMTVQTTENKLITLDMERAIGAHYRLKETLNI